MAALAPLLIEAVVGQAELPALTAAAEQLSQHLGVPATALGGSRGWPVELRVGERTARHVAAPSLVVLSMLGDAARVGEPVAEAERRWRARLDALAADGLARVLVLTVFRYVPRQEVGGAALIERIRRLNLLAAELSHDTGTVVVDLDRTFALVGARALGCDWRMAGPVAAEAAGHAIVGGMLAAGLDAFVPPEREERAGAAHGGLRNLGALVSRRLRLQSP